MRVSFRYGMASLVSAFPVGYIADKHGRSPMIVFGGALSIVAAGATGYVVWVAAEADAKGHGPPEWALPTLAGCMVLWGISGGIVNGPTQALYADSIAHGERSTWYTYLFACWLVSSAVGPAVAVVLFKVYGNGWTLKELRTVMLVGLGIEVRRSIPISSHPLLLLPCWCHRKSARPSTMAEPLKCPPLQQVVAAIPSFFFSDKYALGKENDLAEDEDDDEGDDAGGEKGMGDQADDSPAAAATHCLSCIKKEHVPYIMFVSGLITALGERPTSFSSFLVHQFRASAVSVPAVYAN